MSAKKSVPTIPIVGEDKEILDLFHSVCREPWKVPDLPLPLLRQVHAFVGAWASYLMVRVGDIEARVKTLEADLEINEAMAYTESGKSGMEARKYATAAVASIKRELAEAQAELARFRGRLGAFQGWESRLSREGSLRKIEPGGS